MKQGRQLDDQEQRPLTAIWHGASIASLGAVCEWSTSIWFRGCREPGSGLVAATNKSSMWAVATGTDFLFANFPDAHYHFVEPNPEYHEYIRSNLLPQYKGVLYPVAAGAKRTTMPLTLYGLGSSLLDRSSVTQKLPCVDVQVLPLTEVISPCAVETGSTLLKIDVEGGELDVLCGAQKLIEQSEISTIIVELRLRDISTYNPSELVVFLQKLGFYWKDLISVGHRRGGVNFLDVVFERRERVSV